MIFIIGIQESVGVFEKKSEKSLLKVIRGYSEKLESLYLRPSFSYEYQTKSGESS
jgi:hypothetical protein